MKSVTELLREADPLQNEAMPSSEQREYQRKTILSASSGTCDRAAQEPRSRVTLLVALSFVMIAAFFVTERIRPSFVSNVYAATVHFEVKLAEEEPAPGLLEAKVFGTDSSVYLHTDTIVTNSDISNARIIQVGDSSQYRVGVEFKPSGAEKVRAATARHIGKPMAILLDGRVVMTAKVREPIAGSAVIFGDLSRTEAERIVKGITTVR